MSGLMVHVPGLQTVSEMNSRDHRGTKHARKKAQQKAVYYSWKQAAFGKRIPKPPCVVTFTRFGPRLLDDDNLRAALKACRDTVADLLGIDDGDSRIRFEYEQRIDSEHSVTIQVEEQR